MLAKSSCTSSAVCFLLDLIRPGAESVDSIDESRWGVKAFYDVRNGLIFLLPPTPVPTIFFMQPFLARSVTKDVI